MVTKSDGRREPFDRAKLINGVRSAAKGRPVIVGQIEALAEQVEEIARLEGSEVRSARLGVLVLDCLRNLDEVVYLRFASVYKNFDAAADFDRELRLLQKLGSAPAE